MRVTIRDVAKAAGVTVGTVSRALNGYTDIKPETKQRILEVVKELDYSPNTNAKSLSSRTSKNIAFIVNGVMDNDAGTSSCMEYMQGIYRYALENQYELSIYLSDRDLHAGISYDAFCKQRNISGAILTGITTQDPYFKELLSAGIPCVLIDVDRKADRVGVVGIDNTKAMCEMTEYLYRKGHRKFMVIAGKKYTTVNNDRLAGVYEGLLKNGIVLKHEQVVYCDFSETLAYDFTKQYIAEHGTKDATVFVCFSDMMAIGCMRAIKDSGYLVPEDFSVSGVDGFALGAYFAPALTTIKQNFKEIGYQSAKMLDGLLRSEANSRVYYAPFELVERESVRALQTK